MSRSRKALNTKDDCLPFSRYFSFLGAEEHPKDDVPYLGSFVPGVSNEVGSLNALTHPEKTQKLRKNIPRKTRSSPKNTLVLELEGTLAVSSLTAHWDDALRSVASFQGRCYQVSIKLRPHVEEFLEVLAQAYEVFVFTAAKQDYAVKILEGLGPLKKLIRHQLYQEDCLCLHGSYVKDLSILERDLDQTVAVATCPQAFPYQTSNVILIPRWLGDPQDQVLLQLIPVLHKLTQASDIRVEIGNVNSRSGVTAFH
ncbi:CTD small phosphatase-like protein 2-B isoform X2 [Hemicordylus capensis]|uniref:CTD small phosphatase-like protein 2-B isoform X2 n=1 Tax=Hemicordylus capensis TaxID=884348 RepID=UPI0023045B06|nr:CTD small phosphatase-like protein 2-B isoform X2 [Hemicordylus capensis]